MRCSDSRIIDVVTSWHAYATTLPLRGARSAPCAGGAGLS